MCGIIGYTGEEQAAEKIVKGLETLEYRGYDSAGIALYNSGKIETIKTVGSPKKLEKLIKNTNSTIGIGHTRWATHGAATEKNAHPHLSCNNKFAVVHNGIIENYKQLKEELLNDGFTFLSDTDTEVISDLLEKMYDGDLKSTMIKTLPKLKGSYALGIICVDFPEIIVAAKQSSPLFVCKGDKRSEIVSDISAVYNDEDKIYKLNDGEFSIITTDSVKIFDLDGCRIRKSGIKLRSKDNFAGKGIYAHYMLKEIMEQPEAVRQTLSQFFISSDTVKLKQVKWSHEEISNINRVEFVACGSAYHAGCVGALMAEEFMNIPAEATVASEFRYKKNILDENTLVVIISQSGETADTLAALRKAKQQNAKVVSIVNVEVSTIAQESDCVILTKAGKEVAVATTKAYSAQLAVIYALVIYFARCSGEIGRKQATEYSRQLKALPEKIKQALSTNEQAKELAKKYSYMDYACYIGRGYDRCSALEGSLKLKEISYVKCEAYAAGELKHGTISLIEKGTPVVVINCSDSLKEKTQSNSEEAAARGAEIISVTTLDSCDINTITVPQSADFFMPIITAVPLQLFAYYSALERKCSIDKPRNLAKSVTVE